MSKPPFRRFSPDLPGRRSRLVEDPHGLFLLHADHLRVTEELRNDLAAALRGVSMRDRQIEQLQEELKRVTSPDREPDYYAVPDDTGRLMHLYPSLGLAEAQRMLLVWREGKGREIVKLWEASR